MTYTRRTFLKAGASFAAFAATPYPLLAHFGPVPVPIPPIEDPQVKKLAQHAIDTTRAAGASYADVRLTYTRRRDYGIDGYTDYETLGVGIRALVNGYWGFASSPLWNTEEVTRLSRSAVGLAKNSALGKQRAVELTAVPPVQNGHWEMPVAINPFEVHPSEIVDTLLSLEMYLKRFSDTRRDLNNARFIVQEQAFASTDNSYYTQRVFQSGGQFHFQIEDEVNRLKAGGVLGGLSTAGIGWELYPDQPLYDRLRQTVDTTREEMYWPIVPVDVGRHDVLIGASGTARLISETIAVAAQLDRALGYEANAGGTSYLNDPLSMLGTFKIGAPALTVLANRSEPGGVATVKWDAEGVAPVDYAIVKDGILSNFSTTRESAGWLRGAAQVTNDQIRSNGSAYAENGISAPLGHTPNLRLVPATSNATFDDMVAGMTKGIAFKEVTTNVDFQQLSGLAMGGGYLVKNGKRVAKVGSPGVLFRTPELWKSIAALGGANSAERFYLESEKGEPLQWSGHNVTSVPVLFKDATVIDVLRKA